MDIILFGAAAVVAAAVLAAVGMAAVERHVRGQVAAERRRCARIARRLGERSWARMKGAAPGEAAHQHGRMLACFEASRLIILGGEPSPHTEVFDLAAAEVAEAAEPAEAT